jgi:hypothetical protein
MALAGCSRTVTWQEEVQLSDGRVIVVEGETLRVWGGDELVHGGSGSRPKERRIRLAYPAGSKQIVEWRSTKVSGNLWPEDPLVLDIINGNVMVMTALHTSSACVTYFKYVFHDNKWFEEPLPDEFLSRETNLFLMSGPSMPAFVDLGTKHNENRNIRYPRRLKQVGPHRAFCHG